jgi:hypothetical protein
MLRIKEIHIFQKEVSNQSENQADIIDNYWVAKMKEFSIHILHDSLVIFFK